MATFVTAYWLERKLMFYDGHYVPRFCDVVKIRPGIYYLSYRCHLNGII